MAIGNTRTRVEAADRFKVGPSTHNRGNREDVTTAYRPNSDFVHKPERGCRT